MKICLYCSASEENVPFVTGKNKCKDCYNKWFKVYYKTNQDKKQQNRDLVRKNKPKRKQRNRDLVNNLKRGKPCTDCGISYHPHLMDFDHLNDKVANVSYMVINCWSQTEIIAEISKCELVCSNCHRKRTYIRQFGQEAFDKSQ